jgi:hypothetical protein
MNFSQINTFRPSFPRTSDGDKFGSAVALSADGTLALVGSLGYHTERGRVHFFKLENNTWKPLAAFGQKNAQDYDIFGISISMSSDATMALIGASNRNKGRGAVYFFTRDKNSTQWVEQSLFTATDPTLSDRDQFGISVAMSADARKALVSATHQNFYGKNRGLVYYFTRSDMIWTQQGVLPAPEPYSDDDEFGTCLSLSADGSTALIGAEKSSHFGYRRGLVHFYTASDNVWTQKSFFGASYMYSDDDRFGNSAALSADGTKAIVGAYEHGFGIGKYRGLAYYFTRQDSTWTQQSVFFASDPKSEDGDEFAVSLALTAAGDKALIGAHFQGGHERGRIYYFGVPTTYDLCCTLRNSFFWGAWFR